MSRWSHAAMALMLALFTVDDVITGHPVRAIVSGAFAALNIVAAIWRPR